MSNRWRAVIAGWLAVVVPSMVMGAVEPRVEDGAGFFDPGHVAQVNERIKQIKQEHRRDLIVETFPNIPSKLRDEYQRMSRAAFWKAWAEGRAKRIMLNGVYVLIVRNPRHLEVYWRPGNAAQVTAAEKQRFTQLLLDGLRKNQYDATLDEAVAFFETVAAAHPQLAEAPEESNEPRAEAPFGADVEPPARPTAPITAPAKPVPQPRPTPHFPGQQFPGQQPGFRMGTLICVVVAALIGLMLVRALFRGMGQRGRGWGGQPDGWPMGGGGYHGGGFGRGLLGGLLGGLFGGYVADQFGEQRRRRSDDTGGDAGSSTDFGTSGGDFGSGQSDISGGSGFGGSSDDFGSAGSDFGTGGDSGGGGDGGGSSGGGGDF